MNFELTEERQMLSDMLRRYLADKYDTAARNAILESDQGYSPEIWAGLAEQGVIGALFPEDQGGFGGSGFDIAVVFEELGRAGVVEPLLDTAVLAGALVTERADLVERVIAGDLHLALAHGEPQSRYDLDNVETRAEGLVLTGRKAVVVNAEAAEYLVVSARDGEGIGLYLVRAADCDVQGYPLISGGRAAEVVLDGVTAEARLQAGMAELEAAMARAAVAQMAECLGAMTAASDLTQDYLATRKQFGRPLATFQALQHRVSDMLIEMEQARSALINAAGHLDAAPAERDRQVSAAKSLIGRVGRHIAEEAIQMHGGIAMTQEYELAHIAKRIVMADHRFGDEDWHLERFIALSAA